jgi:hypothetical protein
MTILELNSIKYITASRMVPLFSTVFQSVISDIDITRSASVNSRSVRYAQLSSWVRFSIFVKGEPFFPVICPLSVIHPPTVLPTEI